MKITSLLALVISCLAFTPRASAMLGLNLSDAVSQSDTVACAALPSGEIRCWGEVFPGSETRVDAAHAIVVPGVSHGYNIQVGEDLICAQDWSATSVDPNEDHRVVCWSYNEYALEHASYNGVRTTTMSLTNLPVRVPELDDTAQLAFNVGTYCALSYSGMVRCWGDMSGKYDWLEPVTVPGISGAKKIAVSSEAVCALLQNGLVRCASSATWLRNDYQDDDMPPASQIAAFRVPGLNKVVDLSADSAYFHAVLADGTVRRWGTLAFFSLRSADDDLLLSSCFDRPLIETVYGIKKAEQITGGYGRTTCVIESGGKGSCWSRDFFVTTCGMDAIWDEPVYIQSAGDVYWIAGLGFRERYDYSAEQILGIGKSSAYAIGLDHNLVVYEPVSGDWRPLFPKL